MFLDSTESSLSLEFNKIKFSAKPLAKHWARSQTEEWSILVSGTFVFGTGLYLKCLGLLMARAGNCVLDVLCGIYTSWTFWTKSKLFLRPSMVGFMAGNG